MSFWYRAIFISPQATISIYTTNEHFYFLPIMTCQLPTPVSLPSPDIAPLDSRPVKRKRAESPGMPAFPITPPAMPEDPDAAAMLARAVHVLSVEAAALSHVSRLYTTDPTARASLLRAVEAVVEATRTRSKLVVCGVGKSGYVGQKIVATMKSLGVRASFLHAAEAAHGDLGDVDETDCVLFVSFSGTTAELRNLSSHLPRSTTVLALTAHPSADKCPLLACHDGPTILLPAPIHESEESTFGVCAPTTSTTVALAVGDMLALTVSQELHGARASAVFKKNHPGGAIGARAR
ncbi:SIS domain-containing protein [Microthyrium microscopicum]|uniref:SIS domain-containing protein n=1 Tax=Microthyrium microscopicum TaxID=703497 RepID=A0A6A6UEZ5_9PEZI|nr:SIS domain-containing protein [Microthyrium microscopicum]